MQDYVASLHAAYLEHVRHLPPGERAALPLAPDRSITVAAAAARQLHLIAVDGTLPAVVPGDAAEVEEIGGVRWVVRFYDPSVVPALGLLSDDRPAEVRRILGVADPLYHLTVSVGGGLSAHHAQHSGVALANQHSQLARRLERVRAAVPDRPALADEFAVCVRLGLDRAATALARELGRGAIDLPDDATAATALDAVVQSVRRR